MDSRESVLMEKIENLGATCERIEKWLDEVSHRVSNLERWRSYAIGAISVISFLLGMVGIKELIK